MKKVTVKAVALSFCAAVLFSSCIGSFKLSNKVLDWNNSLGSKFVNELVFLALNIVPVYSITMLADGVVLNSIEFWTGSNPVAFKGEQEINGEKGSYIVKQNKDGYHLINKMTGSSMDLTFDAPSKTWSAEAEGQSFKVITLVDKHNAIVYAADGTSRNVELK
ncbi:membrane protein [Bacteroidia bacterium]|nr:membrane protein [Bacteroidia bacterium]